MMSKKQWSAMLCLHVTYLLLGASIFYHIESPLEMDRRLENRKERLEIQSLLWKNYLPGDHDGQWQIMGMLTEYCGKPVNNITIDDEPAPIWDFYHSFFFSYTVVSTIGYGNLAPTTSFGRILMIFYGLIGVPINGILFANLGEYFGNTFKGLYSRYKSKNPSSGSNIDYQFRRFGLLGQIMLYLIPGFLFFIFLPAGLFVIFEGWDYTLAVYYAFVTLTTIGFGDYVAGITDKGYGPYFIMYKIFLIFWITFGLGYLVMVFGFLTRGLRSKKMLELEHKLAQNLKLTQNKIWNGVTKDVGYLRKMLNEVYMLRFRPVYHDEMPAAKIHRSSSCPSLSFSREETPCVARRRANSEAFPPCQPELQRIASDTDLLAIDRNKTFAATAIVQPAELLARVVDALGSLHSQDSAFQEDGGIHGFSDAEILASERNNSIWSFGGEKIYAVPPKRPRGRAVSEIKVPITDQTDKFYTNNEWTWSSPAASNKIKEIMKQRNFGKMKNPSMPNVSRKSESEPQEPSGPSAPNAPSVPSQSRGILSKWAPLRNRLSSLVGSQKNKISEKEEEMTPDEYLQKTSRGRASTAQVEPQAYLSNTRNGRSSRISLPSENTDLLEQTTIADLIRALTALHSSGAPEMAPCRKLGTASLTPPQLPSLLTLFPPETPESPRQRKFSVHPTQLNSGKSQSITRPSALPPALARRRFSMLPQNNNIPFTPTLSPLVSSTVSQPRRGSLLLPPPYTPLVLDSPSQSAVGRRRMPMGARRMSLRGIGGTPSPRARRPIFPPSISESTVTPSRTRHGSLSDVVVDEFKRK